MDFGSDLRTSRHALGSSDTNARDLHSQSRGGSNTTDDPATSADTKTSFEYAGHKRVPIFVDNLAYSTGISIHINVIVNSIRGAFNRLL